MGLSISGPSASTATAVANLSGGSAGTVPYQSALDTTGMIPAGTSGYFLKSNSTSAPSWNELSLTDLPDAWVKKSVKVATTAAITLSGTQTIDGIALSVGDRVLVKNQATAATNGIYTVAASTWTRATDANTVSKLAGAFVNVDSGTTNGGIVFDTYLKSTDTLDTTAITWNRCVDTSFAVTSGSTSTDGYIRYAGTTSTAGQFDGGTTTPTGTTRLNYSGYLYPTGLNLVGVANTATAATNYFVETATDGFIRPKTLANVQSEIVTTTVLGSGTASGSNFLRGNRTWGSVYSSSSITSASTITPSLAVTQYNVTALAVAASIAVPSGATAADAQSLILRIKDNGTAQALIWAGGSGGYRAIGLVLPSTTIAGKTMYVGMKYNSSEVYWDVVSIAQL